MTQVVSNKTGRKKIVKALGENTEIKITAKQFKDYLEIRTELKLNPEHKFRDEYSISLQPYESKGFARQPMDMGTVGNPSDLSFNLDDISYDTLLFRLKVVDKNNTVKGFADEIKPDLSGGGNDTMMVAMDLTQYYLLKRIPQSNYHLQFKWSQIQSQYY